MSVSQPEELCPKPQIIHFTIDDKQIHIFVLENWEL